MKPVFCATTRTAFRYDGCYARVELRAGSSSLTEQTAHGGFEAWRNLGDAMALQEARQRIRRYLPIDRNVLHDDWPIFGDYPPFWLELGKTVAAFGNLENELTSACYALTAPLADFGELQPDQI